MLDEERVAEFYTPSVLTAMPDGISRSMVEKRRMRFV